MKRLSEFIIGNIRLFRKFWVNQIATSLLGVMITWAMLALENSHPSLDPLAEILASVFCGGMFCFLVYDVFYEQGSKDYIRVSHQKAEKDILFSLKVSFIAYCPTLLIALLGVVFFVCDFGNGYAVISGIMNLAIHGMYSGLFFALPDSINVISFLISMIFTFAAAFFGYYIAMRDTSLRAILGIKQKHNLE